MPFLGSSLSEAGREEEEEEDRSPATGRQATQEGLDRRLAPASRKGHGKGSESSRELWMRGTADGGVWGGTCRRWSASFESAIGKLSWVSGQTGFLRQRLMREDRIFP